MLTVEGRNRLIADEGDKLFVYDDATGKALRPGMMLTGWPTIGIGRNLATRGLTASESAYLLTGDIDDIDIELGRLLPWLSKVDPVRADVIFMVEFNTGNVFAFRKMLAAIQTKNWEVAAKELLDSKAATENNARYQRMSEALLTGTWNVTEVVAG